MQTTKSLLVCFSMPQLLTTLARTRERVLNSTAVTAEASLATVEFLTLSSTLHTHAKVRRFCPLFKPSRNCHLTEVDGSMFRGREACLSDQHQQPDFVLQTLLWCWNLCESVSPIMAAPGCGNQAHQVPRWEAHPCRLSTLRQVDPCPMSPALLSFRQTS